jgi:hypothetical protein
MVVQRKLPGGRGEAYYVLRTHDGEAAPRLVRQGVIGRDIGPTLMEGLTSTLTAAAARTRQVAPVGTAPAVPALV